MSIVKCDSFFVDKNKIKCYFIRNCFIKKDKIDEQCRQIRFNKEKS